MKAAKLSILASSLIVLPGTTRAEIWDGSTTDKLWQTADNWTPATVPNAAGAQVLIDRTQMLPTPPTSTYAINLGPSGAVITVGQIDMETDSSVRFDINKITTGTLVFDNNGSNATWNVETIGANKTTLTVVGTADVVLSDDLVVTSQSTQQFRPTGTITNAAAESHSVTYKGSGEIKLTWASASYTGGTIIDGATFVVTGNLNADVTIPAANSGTDILLKNGGSIGNREMGNATSIATLSRSIEVGTGGGRLIQKEAKGMKFSGVVSGDGALEIFLDRDASNITLAGTVANSYTGNTTIDKRTGTLLTTILTLDKNNALGQSQFITVDDYVKVALTANIIDDGGANQGAIANGATVRLDQFALFDVASGVDEKLSQLEVFNGTSFDVIAAGTYSSTGNNGSTLVSWITGDGTITVAGSGGEPEIAVEDAATNNIPDNDSGSQDFGSVLLGASNSLTFTIKNTGNANLTGLTITPGGSTDFTVTTNPSPPVAGPGGTTTFTVKFAPSSVGLKNATLQIANNDSDENPFDINLSGTGTTTTYNDWTLAKGLTVSNNGATQDPDGDGKSNRYEFAFNGNPLSASDNGGVHVLTEDSAADPETLSKELILTIAARKDAVFTGGSPATSAPVDGISYVIEGSMNLSDFATGVTPVTAITTSLPADVWADYDYFSFSLDGSNGLAGSGFLRAGVAP